MGGRRKGAFVVMTFPDWGFGEVSQLQPDPNQGRHDHAQFMATCQVIIKPVHHGEEKVPGNCPEPDVF